MKYRIGQGFDVHKLKKGRDLYLGGILIDSPHGAVGHSDADVLIHAICDSLLGAAALGDIGTHFPDSSPEFKNIDSKILLSRVVELLKMNHYRISNIDSTLILESPKIMPYIGAIKKSLSQVMGIKEEFISVKATTNERMGYVGRGEGICAHAVALIKVA